MYGLGLPLHRQYLKWAGNLNPWLLIPGLYVVVVVIAFNFVGDGLRDAADPYK